MSDLRSMHKWRALAVSCIDGRFIVRTVEWLQREAGEAFDFRTEVGASKAIIDSPDNRERFFAVIETSIRLHDIKEVWLIDHIDCGAYGGSGKFGSAEEERAFHIKKLREAAKVICNRFSELKVQLAYADWEEIEKL